MMMMDLNLPWTKKIEKQKDRIYFTSKNSELDELQTQLESFKIPKQIEAMKEIIAGMTIGKDVSPLFPYVVNCMRTKDLELKKLIYLYIINFAKIKPNESILAVNSFLIDASDDSNPIIQALAIRTMGCIRVDEIVSYLCDTLKNGLKSNDSYVKKTSCFCVAKLYCTCPQLVIDNGLISLLIENLNDGNAIVLSSTIAALSEISLLSGENYLKISSKILKKLLNALNETNEWGQIYILDFLVNYKKKKTKYAEMIIEASIPLFNHINSAVIMSAVKVVLKYLDHIDEEKKVENFSKKISLCLLSLMDSFPEMQYLLLRAMHSIIQKRHYLFDNDFKNFFVKPYEPIYVKFEKLEILYKLADNKNFELILQEFKSYCILEYDFELVTKAIKYIGKICYKFEKSMKLCVDCIIEIFKYNNEFTIDEGMIVIRDILRKFENEKKPKDLLKIINENICEKVNLPNSKAALLFILGEYSNEIKNSYNMIKKFYDDFDNENYIVKIQVINASIKNFLKNPDDKNNEVLVSEILTKASENNNPDVRDRSYFYWRLLENDPDLAKEMICSEKKTFDNLDDKILDNDLCDNIINNITNMSCIYHKKDEDMLKKEDLLYGLAEKDENNNNDNNNNEEEDNNKVKTNDENNKEINNEDQENEEKKKEGEKKKKKKKNKIIHDQVNQNDIDLLGLGDFISMSGSVQHNTVDNSNNNNNNNNGNNSNNNINLLADILGEGNTNPTSNNNNNINDNNNNNNTMDIFNLSPNNNSNNNNNTNENENENEDDIEFLDNDNEDKKPSVDPSSIQIFSSEEEEQGVSISKPDLIIKDSDKSPNGLSNITILSQFNRINSKIILGLYIINNFNSSLNNFSLQFNKNSFCLKVDEDDENNTNNFDTTINSENKKILKFYISTDNNYNSKQPPDCPYKINAILKTDKDDFNLNIPIKINVLFDENGKMDHQVFSNYFKENKKNSVKYNYTKFNKNLNEKNLNKLLEKNIIFSVARNMKANPPCYYYNCNISKIIPVIIEISYSNDQKENLNNVNVSVISKISQIVPLIKEIIDIMFK